VISCFFRGVLLFFFDSKKTAAEAHRLLSDTYGNQAHREQAVSIGLIDSKDLTDKERPGQPKKFEDAELQTLLDENACQTQKELAMELNVDRSTISHRLHAMGKIRKLGRWVPHQLSENQLKARIEACKKKSC